MVRQEKPVLLMRLSLYAPGWRWERRRCCQRIRKPAYDRAEAVMIWLAVSGVTMIRPSGSN